MQYVYSRFWRSKVHPSHAQDITRDSDSFSGNNRALSHDCNLLSATTNLQNFCCFCFCGIDFIGPNFSWCCCTPCKNWFQLHLTSDETDFLLSGIGGRGQKCFLFSFFVENGSLDHISLRRLVQVLLLLLIREVRYSVESKSHLNFWAPNVALMVTLKRSCEQKGVACASCRGLYTRSFQLITICVAFLSHDCFTAKSPNRGRMFVLSELPKRINERIKNWALVQRCVCRWWNKNAQGFRGRAVSIDFGWFWMTIKAWLFCESQWSPHREAVSERLTWQVCDDSFGEVMSSGWLTSPQSGLDNELRLA